MDNAVNPRTSILRARFLSSRPLSLLAVYLSTVTFTGCTNVVGALVPEGNWEQHRRACLYAQKKTITSVTHNDFSSCDVVAYVKKEAKFEFHTAALMERAYLNGIGIGTNNSGYSDSLLVRGKGPYSPKDVLRWYYERSAKQNYPPAHAALARIYREGEIVGKDLAKAKEFEESAARLGDRPSQKAVIPRYLESEDSGRQQLVLSWLNEMANEGDSAAAHALIGLLDAPGGNFEDREKSFQLLDRLSKRMADPVVKRLLAGRYETGDGVSRDLPLALEMYKDLAEAGDYEACRKIVAYYEKGGQNSELVRSAAIASYKILASTGEGSAAESDAMLKLAFAYDQGNDVEKSESDAFFWYTAAALNGSVAAQFRVAEMYFAGHGTDVDFDAAMNWMEKAANGGHEQARRRMTVIEHERVLRDASTGERTALREMGVGTAAEYGRVVNRMNQSGYEQGSRLSLVLAFLRDERAAQRAGSSALSLKQERDRTAEAQRFERMRLAAEAQRERDEAIAKEYPYIAILTCGLDGDHHANILACFAPSGYSRGTQLELRTGNIQNVYQAHNFHNSGGEERREGFYIDLPKHFHLRAQNAYDGLILGLKIVDRVSGKVLLQRQAAQYRVVEARN